MSDTELKKGDYVLATKWSGGDPQDPWCVGFYNRFDEKWGRHIVVDDEGKPFRPGGFRRAKRISQKRGQWLLDNVRWIELSGKSVWQWIRTPMKTLQ